MAREHDQAKLVGTKKFHPAIADLQGPSDFVRPYDATVATLGNNTVDIYTVPADKILVQQLIGGLASHGSPTDIQCAIWNAPDALYYHIQAYGAAYSLWTNTTMLMYNEGEKIRCYWIACNAGITLWTFAAGYLIDKY